MIAALATIEDGDIVVVAQKAVSKVEGQVVHIDGIVPSAKARELAGDERDPREVEVILQEAVQIIRERGPLVIAQTRHGLICASAGVDHSNAPEPGTLVLLPVDPDASASRLRERFAEVTGKTVGVVITDSFGRPFRQGTTDVAIGTAGITPIIDLRGTRTASATSSARAASPSPTRSRPPPTSRAARRRACRPCWCEASICREKARPARS